MSDYTRRLVSEEQVLAELERLGYESLRMAQEVYPRLQTDAAQAEAAHKALRAKRFLLAKAAAKVSDAVATAHSECDPVIAEAYETRLVTAALADAAREQLRSLRENQAGLRTMAASARGPMQGPGFQ